MVLRVDEMKLMKLHHSITYSFLIAGHTKFAPDRSFELIKKAF